MKSGSQSHGRSHRKWRKWGIGSFYVTEEVSFPKHASLTEFLASSPQHAKNRLRKCTGQASDSSGNGKIFPELEFLHHFFETALF